MALNESDRIKIRLVAAILASEYKYHYTHRQLALKVGTNETKMRVGFKKMYNNTINRQLTQIRIEKAKELLKYTETPLHQIAPQIGFKNASHLIKAFKKATGLTPLVWRSMNNTGLNGDS